MAEMATEQENIQMENMAEIAMEFELWEHNKASHQQKQQNMAEFSAREENILWEMEFVVQEQDFAQTKEIYLAASMKEKARMLASMEETIEKHRIETAVERDGRLYCRVRTRRRQLRISILNEGISD